MDLSLFAEKAAATASGDAERLAQALTAIERAVTAEVAQLQRKAGVRRADRQPFTL